MTPDELRRCLNALRWGTAELAAAAKVSLVTARRWLSGQRAIPANVAETIEAMAAATAALGNRPNAP